jgi:hypothetical protein
MFDLFSSIPTNEPTVQEAYSAYWAVATSENNDLACGTGPVYRFARDLMVRTVKQHFGLTAAQAVWMYEDGPLCEGPGWGSLASMIDYGKSVNFGYVGCQNCLDPQAGVHAIDCPAHA